MRINFYREFKNTVQNNAEKIAVYDGERSISFGDLNLIETKYASAFFNVSKQAYDKPVGVFLPKCIESIAADLAIIHTGNIYMNLDVKYPVERLRNIFNVNQMGLISAINHTYYDDYMNLPSMAFAIAVFIFFYAVFQDASFGNKIDSLIRHMGKNTMAIYLLHFPLLYGIQEAHISPNVSPVYSLGVLVEVTIIFMILYGVSLIWERIPLLNRIIH